MGLPTAARLTPHLRAPQRPQDRLTCTTTLCPCPWIMDVEKPRSLRRRRSPSSLSPTFLLDFNDVVARRRSRVARDIFEVPTVTSADVRKAAFEQIRKMPSWNDRVAFAMNQRRQWRREQRRRAQRRVRAKSPVESVASSIEEDSVDSDDDRYSDDNQSPFLADIDTLVSQRRIRQTHETWVQTDPLQVMFSDFYKLMQG